jgi:hypothetical protein
MVVLRSLGEGGPRLTCASFGWQATLAIASEGWSSSEALAKEDHAIRELRMAGHPKLTQMKRRALLGARRSSIREMR